MKIERRNILLLIASLFTALYAVGSAHADKPTVERRFAIIPLTPILATDQETRARARAATLALVPATTTYSVVRPLYPLFAKRHKNLKTAGEIAEKIATLRSRAELNRAAGRLRAAIVPDPKPVARAMHSYVIELTAPIDIDDLQSAFGAEYQVMALTPSAGDGFSEPLPNGQYFAQQWGLHNTGQPIGQSAPEPGVADQDIDAPLAWASSMGEGSVVALIDSGVRFDIHPDLAEASWLNQAELKIDGVFPGGLDANQDGFVTNAEFLARFSSYAASYATLNNNVDDDGNGFIDDFMGWDVVDFSAFPGSSGCLASEDCFGQDNNPTEHYSANHGTKNASIIAARRENSLIMSGVAPRAKVMAVRAGFGGASGSLFYHTDVGEGVLYAYENGADVASIQTSSIGYSTSLPALEIAYQGGMIIVASAGNEGTSTPRYPAAYNLSNSSTNVLGVGGTTNAGLKNASSSWGSWVSLGAPGRLIFRIGLSSAGMSLGWTSGTSVASPHVAAVVAMVKSKYPCFSSALIESIVVDSTTQYLPQQPYPMGSGLLNAANALQIAPLECDDAAIPGDVNSDGVVNFLDLNIVVSNWDCRGVCQGDADFDAYVGFSDLNLVLGSFNS